ncbi:MAG: tetratricopeptide repeat protein [Chloroflexota bacterium]
MVLKDLGDLSGARVAFERSLKIFKQFLPPDHPNIKIAQVNHGFVKTCQVWYHTPHAHL